jgi:hypothetical protein
MPLKEFGSYVFIETLQSSPNRHADSRDLDLERLSGVLKVYDK